MSNLPRIEHPLFEVKIPSTGKRTKMRPMLVKEEKILLMAKESKDDNAIILAVKQVVNNCLADGTLSANKLTMFDLDYMFIQLRANSIDSTLKLVYTDPEDDPIIRKVKKPAWNPDDPDTFVEEKIQPEHVVDVDLFSIEIKGLDESNAAKLIKTGPETGLKLKWLEAEIYDNPVYRDVSDQEKVFNEMIKSCVETYFDGKSVYNFKDASPDEISEFIDGLDIPTYNKIVDFYMSLPHVYYEVKFKNNKGTERTRVLNKLSDFFMF